MDENNKQYENPVEQVMFILGLKHDPKFETTSEAIIFGENPGVMDAADVVRIYGAIHANFIALSKMIKDSQDAILTPEVKAEIYKIILGEIDEKHYGGRWFDTEKIIPRNWVGMEKYSNIFAQENKIFCLPEPYLKVLDPILSK